MLGNAVVILIGLAAIGSGVWLYQGQQALFENTVEVEGTVATSTVEERAERRDIDDDGMTEDVPVYDAVVEYTYTYDGQRYTADNIYPGSVRSNEFEEITGARDLVDDYPEGSTVTVYVDSRAPDRSYLVRQSNTLRYAVLGILGLVVLGVGVRGVARTKGLI